MARPRTLVIGLDAAEPSLLRRWCESGDMPALRRLAAAGRAGVIDTGSRQFPDSAMLTAYTGIGTARLGRYFFIQPRRDEPRLEILAPTVRGEPFWVTAGRHGRRCIVVDTPKIGLAPPAGGVHVVGWGPHGPNSSLQSAPSELAPALAARHGHYPVPNCDDHGRTMRSYRRLRRGVLDGVAARRRLLLDLARGQDWDLFVAVFAEPHCAGHNLWHFHDPSHPRHRRDPELSDSLRQVYAAVDAAVADLIAAAGDDARVLVFSSQGMRPQYHGRDLIPTLLQLWGMHEPQDRVPGPECRTVHRAERSWMKAAREAVPLPLQYVVKRHLPRRLEQALVCRFMGIMALDVAARAYQVPNNEMCPSLRINLVGRDPWGRVQPGREYDALRELLATRLRELINPATGRPALADVTMVDELHRGEHRDAMPDVVGYWSDAAPITALYSPGYGTVVGEHRDYRTGGHAPDGWLCVAGAPADVADAHIADIAPTVLDLIGVPIPAGLDGRSRLVAG